MTDEATRQALVEALHEAECPSHAGSPVNHAAEWGVGYWPCQQRASGILATEPGSRLTTTDQPDVRAGLVIALDFLERGFTPNEETLDRLRAALSATSEPT
jgi:hypothetical protein